jgi:hypothetical protein
MFEEMAKKREEIQNKAKTPSSGNPPLAGLAGLLAGGRNNLNKTGGTDNVKRESVVQKPVVQKIVIEKLTDKNLFMDKLLSTDKDLSKLDSCEDKINYLRDKLESTKILRDQYELKLRAYLPGNSDPFNVCASVKELQERISYCGEKEDVLKTLMNADLAQTNYIRSLMEKVSELREYVNKEKDWSRIDYAHVLMLYSAHKFGLQEMIESTKEYKDQQEKKREEIETRELESHKYAYDTLKYVTNFGAFKTMVRSNEGKPYFTRYMLKFYQRHGPSLQVFHRTAITKEVPATLATAYATVSSFPLFILRALLYVFPVNAEEVQIKPARKEWILQSWKKVNDTVYKYEADAHFDFVKHKDDFKKSYDIVRKRYSTNNDTATVSLDEPVTPSNTADKASLWELLSMTKDEIQELSTKDLVKRAEHVDDTLNVDELRALIYHLPEHFPSHVPDPAQTRQWDIGQLVYTKEKARLDQAILDLRKNKSSTKKKETELKKLEADEEQRQQEIQQYMDELAKIPQESVLRDNFRLELFIRLFEKYKDMKTGAGCKSPAESLYQACVYGRVREVRKLARSVEDSSQVVLSVLKLDHVNLKCLSVLFRHGNVKVKRHYTQYLALARGRVRVIKIIVDALLKELGGVIRTKSKRQLK